MTRRLLAVAAICAALAGLWALASKPLAAYMLGEFDDERQDRADRN